MKRILRSAIAVLALASIPAGSALSQSGGLPPGCFWVLYPLGPIICLDMPIE